jgi:hypothetical protein
VQFGRNAPGSRQAGQVICADVGIDISEAASKDALEGNICR